MKNKLHPGAKWIFRLGAYFGFAFFGIFFLSWLIGPLIAVIFKAVFGLNTASVVGIVVSFLIFYVLFVVIAAEIYARMAYNRWFYEFDKHGLKLERGIIWKRYSNVPYERVQNVDIHRGIIARMLGFSSVNIQTAGYSAVGRGGYLSEGYIPAVDMEHAEQIREFLMKKISKKGQGL